MLPSEKQIFMQRVRALQKLVNSVPNGPRQVTEALLINWQINRFANLPHHKNECLDDLLSNEEIKRLAMWLVKRSFLDAAFWLSSAYAIWVGEKMRSHNAMYFTPPSLADRLIDNLVQRGGSLTTHVWLDPACGGCSFLASIAIRMIDAHEKAGIKKSKVATLVAGNLMGFELDSNLAWLSEQFLLMVLHECGCDIPADIKFNIAVIDGLMSNDSIAGRADVIICNPPYRKMKSGEAEFYRDHYGDIFEGQPNIYGLFISSIIKRVKPNGIAGLLTPTSYLSGKNFSKIRKQILEKTAILQIDIIDEREGVFIGVEQGVALTIFKKTTEDSHSCSNVDISALNGKFEFLHIGTCEISTANSGDAWLIPKSIEDIEWLRLARRSAFRLSDYGYKARTGVYVDYRDERATYSNCPSNSKEAGIFPLIWSSDIGNDGTMTHGRLSQQNGRHTFIEMSDPNHPAVIRKKSVALQRVTSHDQPRRLVAAPVTDSLISDYGGVVGENHVVFLESFRDDAMSPKHLSALLSSAPIDRIFRCMSGAVNVSIFELNQMPLPNPVNLKILLNEGVNMDLAVLKAYGG